MIMLINIMTCLITFANVQLGECYVFILVCYFAKRGRSVPFVCELVPLFVCLSVSTLASTILHGLRRNVYR